MIIKKCRNHKQTNTVNKLIEYVEAKAIINYAQAKTSKVWYLNLPNDKEIATKLMQATQNKNTHTKAIKTYHYVISFREGEYPSDDTLKKIEQSISDKLGFNEHQRILAVHNDTAHYHMHVIVNKIHPLKYTNKTPFNDYLKMDEIAKELEIKFNLQKDNRINYKDRYKNNKAKDMEAHTGEQSLESFIKENVKEKIEKLLSEKINWQEIHNILAKHNLFIKEKT